MTVVKSFIWNGPWWDLEFLLTDRISSTYSNQAYNVDLGDVNYSATTLQTTNLIEIEIY